MENFAKCFWLIFISLFILLGASLAFDLEEKFDDGTVGAAPGKMSPEMIDRHPLVIMENGMQRIIEADIEQRVDLLPPIFPGPKYRPGDTMKGTDFEDINEALDAVMKAASLTQGDRCAIGHANVEGADQKLPSWYLYYGQQKASPPPSLAIKKTALMLFHKSSWSLAGTMGVYTYGIDGTDYKIAVMWQIPYDTLLFNRLFNVKVYPKSYETGKDMYKQMYSYAGPWKPNGYKARSEYGVDLTGTMTNNSKSKLIAWSNTTGFDENGRPDLFTECSYNWVKFKSYCTLECTSGWCWSHTRCDKDTDCQGVALDCRSKC